MTDTQTTRKRVRKNYVKWRLCGVIVAIDWPRSGKSTAAETQLSDDINAAMRRYLDASRAERKRTEVPNV